jgi:integrase
MNQLATLWKRPSYDGKRFTYYLLYTDEQGRRRQKSLKHADARKAERQRAQFERELRMGVVEIRSMKLSAFLEDSLRRTCGQVRESTLVQHSISMKHFIKVVGDIDFLKIRHEHGERFVQTCVAEGNSLATANKKIRSLKRLFQLAVERCQFEENPFKKVRKPRVPRRKVRVYSQDECERLIRSGQAPFQEELLQWDLLILLALSTGMRRGELLNATWTDIDFERQTIDVSPKRKSDRTWEWHIKDADTRTLPLIEEVALLLARHREKLPCGFPYVFVPPVRYGRIQKARKEGRWKFYQSNCPINNFTRQFKKILAHAGIERGEFHDLRRTCLSSWFASGLAEYDIMNLAGHADFDTTRRFYLAVREDLLQRARKASAQVMRKDFVAKLLQHHSEGQEKGLPPSLSA